MKHLTRIGLLLILWHSQIFALESKPTILTNAKNSVMAARCKVKSAVEIKNNIGELRVKIDKMIEDHKANSVSIAISAKGKTIYSQGFGKGVNTETLFEAGSLSKPVVAFGVLKLSEAGVINLDKPLSRYTHSSYFEPESQGNMITARQVLSHTSGMGSDIMGTNRLVSFTPGTQFAYSRAGFRFLQQALEDKTNKPFSTLMRPFLEDLGMRNSTFELPFQGKTFVNASASFRSTPTERSFLFHQLVTPKKENRKVAEQMLKKQIKLGANLAWGLGIGQYKCEDETVIWHWGSNFETNFTLAVFYKQTQTGVILMSSGKGSQKMLRELVLHAIGGNNFRYWDDVPRAN